MPINTKKQAITATALGLISMISVVTYLSITRAADTGELKDKLDSVSKIVEVAVAVRDLPAGTIISREDIKYEKAVVAHLPSDAIGRNKKIIGSETRSDIYSGEPLIERRIAKTGAKRASRLVKPGCVALAVGVDDVAGVAGGIRSGDHVDVLISEEGSGETDILFSGVRVLGVSGKSPFSKFDENNEQANALQAESGAAVVLELKDVEAEVLTEASISGILRLALRAAY